MPTTPYPCSFVLLVLKSARRPALVTSISEHYKVSLRVFCETFEERDEVVARHSGAVIADDLTVQVPMVPRGDQPGQWLIPPWSR